MTARLVTRRRPYCCALHALNRLFGAFSPHRQALRASHDSAASAPMSFGNAKPTQPSSLCRTDATTMNGLVDGGRADLLLLKANPLDNIHHTRRIRHVLAGQWLLGLKALRAGQERIAAWYAALPPLTLHLPEAA